MTTYNITITGFNFRGALQCAASQDVRYYLNGVHFDTENLKMVSTTGHYLFVCDLLECSDNLAELKPFTFERFKIPANILTVHLSLDSDDLTRCSVELVTKQGARSTMIINVIDGNFPNYKQVVQVYNTRRDPLITDFNINGTFLALVEKVFGKKIGVKMQFNDYNSAVTIVRNGDDEYNKQLVIMPMR